MYRVLKTKFGFKKPIWTKTLATVKFVKTNLQNYASDNLKLRPIKATRWLSKLILTMGAFT